MYTQNVMAATIVTFGLLLFPRPAAACSCAGTPSTPGALRSSDLVFLGTVVSVSSPLYSMRRTNADGSITISGGTQPSEVRFSVVRTFRGVATESITMRSSSGNSCDFTFARGESWLIYADVRDTVVSTHKCKRTRLQAEASQDLRYLEGVARGESLGVVSGQVFRRVTTPAGESVLKAVEDAMQIVGVVGGQRIATAPDRWGPYQLVLPPGDAQIWVERDGVVVSPGVLVRVKQGEVVEVQLAAEYEK